MNKSELASIKSNAHQLNCFCFRLIVCNVLYVCYFHVTGIDYKTVLHKNSISYEEKIHHCDTVARAILCCSFHSTTLDYSRKQILTKTKTKTKTKEVQKSYTYLRNRSTINQIEKGRSICTNDQFSYTWRVCAHTKA